MADQKPIKTPPMSPIPQKPVSSYPTPIVTDRLLVEYVGLEVGATENLAYGSLFENSKHTAFTKPYTGFELVYRAPAIGPDGWWERRVWVNPRIDQDTYNYSLVFAEGDNDFPTITRTYVVKRSEYVADAPLSEDPDFTGAFLVDEKMINETNPPEINSLYVTVLKTYMTLPGPIVLSQDFDSELNIMVTTSRQVVLSSDEYDPTGTPLLLEARETPQTKYIKLRILSYLEALPEDKVEYQTGRYPFPALVSDIDLSVVELTTDPQRSEVIWFPVMRSEPNVPAIFRVTTSFATTSPTPVTLYAINAQNLIYRGISFQIAINQALNDAISVTAAFTADARYGSLSETKAWSATTPSAAEYTADIGEYKDVGCDITRWRGQIWVEVVQAVLLV